MQTQTANGKQLATHFSAMKLLAETLYLLLLCRFSHVRLCATPLMAAHEAPPSWDSPDKNTGVGCHFLLQCMKVKSESEVAQLCPTLSDPMDYSLPGSSVHGIFQARVLEWGPIAFSYTISAYTDVKYNHFRRWVLSSVEKEREETQGRYRINKAEEWGEKALQRKRGQDVLPRDKHRGDLVPPYLRVPKESIRKLEREH